MNFHISGVNIKITQEIQEYVEGKLSDVTLDESVKKLVAFLSKPDREAESSK